jgi:hypothetical protein
VSESSVENGVADCQRENEKLRNEKETHLNRSGVLEAVHPNVPFWWHVAAIPVGARGINHPAVLHCDESNVIKKTK